MKATRRQVALSALAFAAGVASPSLVRAATTTLRFGTPDGATHPNGVAAQKFISLVQEKTKGAVEIKFFPDGQLGTIVNLIAGLQTGTVDLSIQSPTFFEGMLPAMGVVNLPFLFPDEKRAEAILDGPLGTRLLDGIAAKGIYGFCWSYYGWRVTETRTKEIHGPDDFKGLKIRLPAGAVWSDSFKALGAIPTVIDPSELYLAMSQGAIDAFEVPFASLVASKWYEVIKYVSLTNHSYNPQFLCASKISMDKLPADQQKAIRESAAEITSFWRKAITDYSTESREFCEKRGIKVIQPDTQKIRQVVVPVYERFRDKIGAEFYDSFLKAVTA